MEDNLVTSVDMLAFSKHQFAVQLLILSSRKFVLMTINQKLKVHPKIGRQPCCKLFPLLCNLPVTEKFNAFPGSNLELNCWQCIIIYIRASEATAWSVVMSELCNQL